MYVVADRLLSIRTVGRDIQAFTIKYIFLAVDAYEQLIFRKLHVMEPVQPSPHDAQLNITLDQFMSQSILGMHSEPDAQEVFHNQKRVFDVQPILWDDATDANSVSKRPKHWYYRKGLLDELKRNAPDDIGKKTFKSESPLPPSVRVPLSTKDSNMVRDVICMDMMKSVCEAMVALDVNMKVMRPGVQFVPDIIGYVKTEGNDAAKLLMITETGDYFKALEEEIKRDVNGELWNIPWDTGNRLTLPCPTSINADAEIHWSLDGVVRTVRSLLHRFSEKYAYGGTRRQYFCTITR